MISFANLTLPTALLLVLAVQPVTASIALAQTNKQADNQTEAENASSTESAPSAGPLDTRFISAQELAQRIVSRPANAGRTGEMHFEMRNKRGRTRERAAVLLFADQPEVTKLAIHFTAPAAIRDTGFLSHNADRGPDQSWLYLPATDRVRRLPASDRGDYFMGTDLTFGDLQDNFKFALEDWSFTSVAPKSKDGKTFMTLTGIATEEARKDMGYSKFHALIDPATLFPVHLVYSDIDGAPLKELEILAQEKLTESGPLPDSL